MKSELFRSKIYFSHALNKSRCGFSTELFSKHVSYFSFPFTRQDEGAHNLTLLEEAINEDAQQEVDYAALLNDSDDDDLLLSQM